MNRKEDQSFLRIFQLRMKMEARVKKIRNQCLWRMCSMEPQRKNLKRYSRIVERFLESPFWKINTQICRKGNFQKIGRNAYVEFIDVESVDNAIYLSGTKLRNRAIKVQRKRTNVKGMAKNNFGGFLNMFGRGGRNWRGRGRWMKMNCNCFDED